MYIYTITMVRGLFDEDRIKNLLKGEIYTDTRCVGFLWTCDQAVDAALFDEMMWEEGYYRYCCIESVQQGIPPLDMNPLWIDSMGNVIDAPPEYKQTVCLGIG